MQLSPALQPTKRPVNSAGYSILSQQDRLLRVQSNITCEAIVTLVTHEWHNNFGRDYAVLACKLHFFTARNSPRKHFRTELLAKFDELKFEATCLATDTASLAPVTTYSRAPYKAPIRSTVGAELITAIRIADGAIGRLNYAVQRGEISEYAAKGKQRSFFLSYIYLKQTALEQITADATAAAKAIAIF
jgi:hypothetical protein